MKKVFSPREGIHIVYDTSLKDDIHIAMASTGRRYRSVDIPYEDLLKFIHHVAMDEDCQKVKYSESGNTVAVDGEIFACKGVKPPEDICSMEEKKSGNWMFGEE